MAYDLDEDVFYIFTDWASRPWLGKKPKRVWGMWIIFAYLDENGDKVHKDMSEECGRVWATNNDMELGAVINWLKLIIYEDLSNFKKIMVVVDSLYVLDNYKNAVYWNRNWTGWNTRMWNPVIHKKQWKELAKYYKKVYDTHHLKLGFDKVKAHENNEENNMADKSAVKETQSKVRVKASNTTVRAKFFKKTKRYKGWYLPIQGKEVYIHIYSSRPLNKWIYRHNIELVSRDNEFITYCWWIYHTILSAEFIYLVRIKDDDSYQVDEVLETLDKKPIKDKIIETWLTIDIFK